MKEKLKEKNEVIIQLKNELEIYQLYYEEKIDLLKEKWKNME